MITLVLHPHEDLRGHFFSVSHVRFSPFSGCDWHRHGLRVWFSPTTASLPPKADLTMWVTKRKKEVIANFHPLNERVADRMGRIRKQCEGKWCLNCYQTTKGLRTGHVVSPQGLRNLSILECVERHSKWAV